MVGNVAITAFKEITALNAIGAANVGVAAARQIGARIRSRAHRHASLSREHKRTQAGRHRRAVVVSGALDGHD